VACRDGIGKIHASSTTSKILRQVDVGAHSHTEAGFLYANTFCVEWRSALGEVLLGKQHFLIQDRLVANYILQVDSCKRHDGIQAANLHH